MLVRQQEQASERSAAPRDSIGLPAMVKRRPTGLLDLCQNGRVLQTTGGRALPAQSVAHCLSVPNAQRDL